jgi:hypothetical protein
MAPAQTLESKRKNAERIWQRFHSGRPPCAASTSLVGWPADGLSGSSS